ncbi:transposase [Streptomyces sp. NPDC048266]|uniref:transposase n=1 Tax=Streptomyces sp. NPDC048266 TaxID=3155787 RepID=UPI003405FCF3
MVFAFADVQAQVDVDGSLVRHAGPSRACALPGLTCGISVPASALRRDCPRALVPLISGLPMPPAPATPPFRSPRLGARVIPGPKAGSLLARPRRRQRCSATPPSAGPGQPDQQHSPCWRAVGRPLAFVLTGGNTNDCTQLTAVREKIRVPRLAPGRPRVRPDHVLGDKGCSSKAIRAWLRRDGIGHTIPERADQIRNRLRRGSRVGCRPIFDKQLYKRHNVVERCFNRLKQWRGIATRYGETAESYQAAVTFASPLMWA